MSSCPANDVCRLNVRRLVFLMFWALVPALTAHEWTRYDGRKVVAELVAVGTDGTVQLRSAGQPPFRLPLDELSADDHLVVCDWLKAATGTKALPGFKRPTFLADSEPGMTGGGMSVVGMSVSGNTTTFYVTPVPVRRKITLLAYVMVPVFYGSRGQTVRCVESYLDKSKKELRESDRGISKVLPDFPREDYWRFAKEVARLARLTAARTPEGSPPADATVVEAQSLIGALTRSPVVQEYWNFQKDPDSKLAETVVKKNPGCRWVPEVDMRRNAQVLLQTLKNMQTLAADATLPEKRLHSWKLLAADSAGFQKATSQWTLPQQAWFFPLNELLYINGERGRQDYDCYLELSEGGKVITSRTLH